MAKIGATPAPSTGGATLPIAESDVTNLTTDLAAKAADSLAVHLAGAETLTGVKLFQAGFRYDQQAVSGTATLVDGTQPLVVVDTTSTAFTITLPAAPSAGSVFLFHDKLGTWATNNLTIGRNGKNIDGAASNKVCATNFGVFALQYNGTDWRTIWDILSAANPLINGTAAPGTSQDAARSDHVHPTDTTRAPLASPTFTGTVTLPEGNDAAAGTASRRTLGTGATQAMQGSLAAPLASPAFTGHPTGVTEATGNNSTRLATTAYVDALIFPDYWTANDAFARPSANEVGVATAALIPYLYPIEPKGRRTFALNSLAMKVTTLVAASTMGCAIYSWSLSGSTFTLTLVAVISATIDGSTAGTKVQAITGAPVTLDFTANKYFAAGMASTVTTLQFAGSTVTAGTGAVRYSGAARATAIDFPATIDNNAGGNNNGAALNATTRMSWLGLLNSAGVNWP